MRLIGFIHYAGPRLPHTNLIGYGFRYEYHYVGTHPNEKEKEDRGLHSMVGLSGSIKLFLWIVSPDSIIHPHTCHLTQLFILLTGIISDYIRLIMASENACSSMKLTIGKVSSLEQIFH